MKEEELSHENIKQLLNRSVAQLERPTLTRLQHAREQALSLIHISEPTRPY